MRKSDTSFFLDFTYLFLERGREKRRETSVCGCLSYAPTGDLACNPGMCPDWESNRDPLVHRPELNPLSHTSQGTVTNQFYMLIT